MPIAKSDFDYVCTLVRNKSGIVLEAGKEYLVEARLNALARQQNIDSIADLVARLRSNPLDPLHRLSVEAMTTNETSFFRDHSPFEALKSTILPALLTSRANTKSLSIWCAASSTGQEPYSIAMTLCEAIPNLSDWKIIFIATDLSLEMVARSRAGAYNQIEINRGLPAKLLVKHFDKNGLTWQIKENIRKMVEFREMNLTLPWLNLPQADIIFMRNVLIYFDNDTKRGILAQARRILRPDGYLFLGSAETTMGLDDSFERTQIEKSGTYRLRQSAALKAA
jgi:chemotaxis protein methyltransferase CheR